MKNQIKHFSLVEILTVIAIIGILAGISLGITGYVRNKNREVQTQTTIKMLEMVLEQYKNKYGGYPAINGKPGNTLGNEFFQLPAEPDDDDPLTALFHDVSYNGSEIVGIKGVNIVRNGDKILILDGWESPILYIYPGVFNKTTFDLGSAGADKKIGDSGDKFTKTTAPTLGSRNTKTDAYRANFGTADDITNFKR
jgi:prepilin-type N-terminal cleavage/methylation domain-containing protein